MSDPKARGATFVKEKVDKKIGICCGSSGGWAVRPNCIAHNWTFQLGYFRHINTL